ncbi:hypothetical protein NA57DRAFT_54220 [Rhizodiscina lignyota]|uniref:Peptidase C14 caspase domain-containing protein n=1 Tax=Rhizodiscina lignyota TaxID=1504668 RepID=A0A9P4ILT9_9PEZI|nr:hypothetical protein NA57DRAFT_54220 [Rhizodiscina lignyota]
MSTTDAPIVRLDMQSVDNSCALESQALIAGPPEARPIPDDEQKSQLAASEMQLWWNEGCGSTGYKHVAVLLVKWIDELDDLKCGEEVYRLRDVFRDSFHYEAEVVELNIATNVDIQLSLHFTTFLKKHDGQDTLIVVYYSGHGSHEKKLETLTLHPTNRISDTNSQTEHNWQAKAVWEKAEVHLLENAKCDALSILDCCFAGDVHKGGIMDDDRTYQLLSAAGRQKPTNRPGPRSFTSALIQSLMGLLEERQGRPFTTLQLQNRISQQEHRTRNPPFLWHRLKRDERMIFLSPLAKRSRKNSLDNVEPSRAFLTFRIALSEERLNEKQVKELGKGITQAAETSGAPYCR